jgi:hypothetical protein
VRKLIVAIVAGVALLGTASDARPSPIWWTQNWFIDENTQYAVWWVDANDLGCPPSGECIEDLHAAVSFYGMDFCSDNPPDDQLTCLSSYNPMGCPEEGGEGFVRWIVEVHGSGPSFENPWLWRDCFSEEPV